MTTREARLDRWRFGLYAIWALIGAGVIAYYAGSALGRIAGALAPFVVAFLFVFVLQGPVERLAARGMSRGLAVATSFVLGLAVIGVALFFIAPVIGRQLVAFAAAIPTFLEEGRQLLQDAQQQFSDVVVPNWLRNATISVAESISALFVSLGNAIARGLLEVGGGFATVVFDLFIGIVIAFWTLKDLPKIRAELRVLAGDKYEDDLENLLTTIGKMVGGYLKGQTIASLVTGLVAGVGLAIIGVPFAFVLGIITFVTNYVPYVGPLIAGIIAAALGLFEGPFVALGAIVIVIGAQNLTDAFVTPRVMSDQVDLHPTLVIFSLLVGGSLFGFWGMIFAIPVAATAKALFVYYWERRTSRQLATEDGALFKMPTCDEDSGEPCADSADAEPGDPEHPMGPE